MAEAFDKATGLLAAERDAYEDEAVTQYYISCELQRLLKMATRELARTDRFMDWIATADLDWEQINDNRLTKTCGEDTTLVTMWLESKGG